MDTRAAKVVIAMLVAILFVAVTVIAACAPTGIPAVTPSPTTPATTITASSTTAPKLSPQEAEWQKVMDAARKEGRVTAYSYNFLGDVGIGVQRAFEQKYGIKLDIITGLGAQFLEKIKTEKRMGQMTGDFTEGSIINLHSMRIDGLLLAIDESLPVVKEEGVWVVEPAGLDPRNKEVLPFFVSYNTPYVNTKLVNPGEEPKSYFDLLDPKWKGKLGIPDPSTVPSAYDLFVPLLEQKVLDEEYLKALGKQNMLFYKSLPDALSALSRGEHSVLVRSSDSTAASFAKEGAPIRAVGMKEGTISSGGAIGAIKGGPHPNAARVFINWAISKEGQTVFTSIKGNSSIRKDVPDARPEAVRAVAFKVIMATPEHNTKSAELMRERYLLKLWGR